VFRPTGNALTNPHVAQSLPLWSQRPVWAKASAWKKLQLSSSSSSDDASSLSSSSSTFEPDLPPASDNDLDAYSAGADVHVQNKAEDEKDEGDKEETEEEEEDEEVDQLDEVSESENEVWKKLKATEEAEERVRMLAKEDQEKGRKEKEKGAKKTAAKEAKEKDEGEMETEKKDGGLRDDKKRKRREKQKRQEKEEEEEDAAEASQKVKEKKKGKGDGEDKKGGSNSKGKGSAAALDKKTQHAKKTLAKGAFKKPPNSAAGPACNRCRRNKTGCDRKSPCAERCFYSMIISSLMIYQRCSKRNHVCEYTSVSASSTVEEFAASSGPANPEPSM
jgi:hypothetical protein